MKNLLFILAIFAYTACSNEEPLTLNEGEILNELHETNVGKIAFMGTYIPFSEFEQTDFASSLMLSPNSEINIRMFLAKTLTYYLQELEPALSVRELCGKGNFQLTFYVDDQEIHKYNLPTGAGSCEFRNEQTVYGIPLVDAAESDHWGRFTWMKFMKRDGGQEALAGGSHQLKIEVRPYIEHKEFKAGAIIASGAVELTLVEEDVDEEQIAIQTIAPTDQWTLATAAYDQDKIRALNSKIAQQYFKDITSLVVIKDGELLIEEYFNEADRSTLHNTRSVGKSFASTVLGIAIEEGHIKNEQATLAQFYQLNKYQNNVAPKGKVTLRSLLTMSSGFLGSDMDMASPGNEENMYPTNDWVEFTLDLPMDETKTMEQDWDYFTAGVVVLGDIIHQKVPGGLVDYTQEKLFAPLGIENVQWQYTPQEVGNTAGGLQLTSLGYATYAQAYVDKGKNRKGEQVIPANWVTASHTKHLAIPETSNEFYGYLFWNKTYDVNGQSYEAWYASGNGGNKIMMFPEQDIVIVLTATAYGQPYMHPQANEIIGKYVLPAVVEK